MPPQNPQTPVQDFTKSPPPVTPDFTLPRGGQVILSGGSPPPPPVAAYGPAPQNSPAPAPYNGPHFKNPSDVMAAYRSSPDSPNHITKEQALAALKDVNDHIPVRVWEAWKANDQRQMQANTQNTNKFTDTVKRPLAALTDDTMTQEAGLARALGLKDYADILADGGHTSKMALGINPDYDNTKLGQMADGAGHGLTGGLEKQLGSFAPAIANGGGKFEQKYEQARDQAYASGNLPDEQQAKLNAILPAVGSAAGTYLLQQAGDKVTGGIKKPLLKFPAGVGTNIAGGKLQNIIDNLIDPGNPQKSPPALQNLSSAVVQALMDYGAKTPGEQAAGAKSSPQETTGNAGQVAGRGGPGATQPAGQAAENAPGDGKPVDLSKTPPQIKITPMPPPQLLPAIPDQAAPGQTGKQQDGESSGLPHARTGPEPEATSKLDKPLAPQIHVRITPPPLLDATGDKTGSAQQTVNTTAGRLAAPTGNDEAGQQPAGAKFVPPALLPFKITPPPLRASGPVVPDFTKPADSQTPSVPDFTKPAQ